MQVYCEASYKRLRTRRHIYISVLNVLPPHSAYNYQCDLNKYVEQINKMHAGKYFHFLQLTYSRENEFVICVFVKINLVICVFVKMNL
jgi:hypothetical protein